MSSISFIAAVQKVQTIQIIDSEAAYKIPCFHYRGAPQLPPAHVCRFHILTSAAPPVVLTQLRMCDVCLKIITPCLKCQDFTRY